MKALPKSVRQFVERQPTKRVADLLKGEEIEEFSRYGSYWHRAVACMLLSGRVNAKSTGWPNRTEVNRICKEANFNQYLTERVGDFLVAARVVEHNRRGQYIAGPALPAFWNHDAEVMRQRSRQAVVSLAHDLRNSSLYKLTESDEAHLGDLLTLFCACFRELALPATRLLLTCQEMVSLPAEDLTALARHGGLGAEAVDVERWQSWLGGKYADGLMQALSTAEWFYATRGEGQDLWVFPSAMGLGMLGLAKPPPVRPLPTSLEVLSNGIVRAGAGLPVEQLVPLFRHCIIKRIDEVYEFQVDRRRLAQTPAGTDPGEELRQALQTASLPAEFEELLRTESNLGGSVEVHWCSALVKPESAEVLKAIRRHPQLKNYLATKAPPGFLLIKPDSRPDNFVRRCRELGFDVQLM